ncbi:Delta-subunit of ethylbenzene dehydrogenase [Georgfuchsia toluolica]|uniref:Delta-subunit of ethylbenzene dehydrogenase n=1 Tax=Georgfuchsia toluolica TaxID=424218 RepID=A0A916J4M4_9PROT|nr:ethylbenzene dehydrogenase subunit delta [Georgfuchsia toluolica]CAG4883891.1 Delta-subunit of ethylbenzene dehydrogenase [Georgfuchsia toluolica]
MNDKFELKLPEHKRATAARSEIYKILSGIFIFPSDGQQKNFVLQGAGVALREAASELPFGVPSIESLGPGYASMAADDDDLEVTYTSLFDNCTGKSALSLYEKDYSTKDTKQIWEDLIRFYEHFGLHYDLAKCKEWPDHISTQLEFLHYLTFLEAGAPDDMVDVYMAAESDFLERHVVEWIPKFSEKLLAMAEDSPYAGLSQVLAQFVEEEMEFNRRRRTIQ